MRRQQVIFNNVSLGADAISTVVSKDDIKAISFQNVVSGAPNGSLKIQISNDYTDKPELVTNWDDVTGSSIAIVAAGLVSVELETSFKWIRLYFTYTSGSGHITTTSHIPLSEYN